MLRLTCCYFCFFTGIVTSVFPAQLRINNGTFQLNSSETCFTCNDVTIGSNACLAGTGQLRANTQIEGQVAPETAASSDAAQLTFHSNLVFISGSKFTCDVFSNTNCDLLAVYGTVSGTGQVVAAKQADGIPLDQSIIVGSAGCNYDSLTIYQPQPYSWELTASGEKLLLTDLRGDSNDDGMPDWWEAYYFGGRTNAVAQDDNDGDQSVNIGEYVAGTDPLQDSSCLAVDTDTTPTDDHILSWPGAAGRTYTLYRCTNLLEGAFSACAVDLPATEPLTVYTDTTFSADSTYYRVQAEFE